MRPYKPTLAAVVVLALSFAVFPLGSSARADSTVLQDPAPRALDAAAIAAVLGPFREKRAVAAIAGAIVTSRGLQTAGVVGLARPAPRWPPPSTIAGIWVPTPRP